MNCPVCLNLMIKAKATNFGEEYDYCRTCKKELSELGGKNQTEAADFLFAAGDLVKLKPIGNIRTGARTWTVREVKETTMQLYPDLWVYSEFYERA